MSSIVEQAVVETVIDSTNDVAVVPLPSAVTTAEADNIAVVAVREDRRVVAVSVLAVDTPSTIVVVPEEVCSSEMAAHSLKLTSTTVCHLLPMVSIAKNRIFYDFLDNEFLDREFLLEREYFW